MGPHKDGRHGAGTQRPTAQPAGSVCSLEKTTTKEKALASRGVDYLTAELVKVKRHVTAKQKE
jgi:hypothetical protein